MREHVDPGGNYFGIGDLVEIRYGGWEGFVGKLVEMKRRDDKLVFLVEFKISPHRVETVPFEMLQYFARPDATKMLAYLAD